MILSVSRHASDRLAVVYWCADSHMLRAPDIGESPARGSGFPDLSSLMFIRTQTKATLLLGNKWNDGEALRVYFVQNLREIRTKVFRRSKWDGA